MIDTNGGRDIESDYDDKVNENDFFIYRSPTRNSEIMEFYFLVQVSLLT